MPMSAAGTKLNRRGLETRERILATAVRVLADGGPEAVSANLVAREAGVTWGTIQHQFGGADGLWAGVVDRLVDALDTAFPAIPDLSEAATGSETLAGRITAIVDFLWSSFDSAPSRAVRNLRVAVDADDPASEHPATARSLDELERRWSELLDHTLAEVVTDAERLVGVRVMLPGAVRGIYLDSATTSPATAASGRRCLVESLTAYLAS